MEKLRLLITGATGLIGRELTSAANSLGFEVFSAEHTNKPEFGKPVFLDLSSEDSIRRAFEVSRPACVVHLAAMTDVDGCEKDWTLALRMNCGATELIAKESTRCGSHLVYVSTDYVFDGEKGMYKEEDRTSPINRYGRSKLLGEKAVEQYAERWSILRTSTPYGLHPRKKTFPVLVAQRLLAGAQLQVATDQSTSPTYTADLATMILEVVGRTLEGKFHLSSSNGISRYQFAKMVAESMSLDSRLLVPVPSDRLPWLAKRPRDSSLNVAKASSFLEAKPKAVADSLKVFVGRLFQESIFFKSMKDK